EQDLSVTGRRSEHGIVRTGAVGHLAGIVIDREAAVAVWFSTPDQPVRRGSPQCLVGSVEGVLGQGGSWRRSRNGAEERGVGDGDTGGEPGSQATGARCQGAVSGGDQPGAWLGGTGRPSPRTQRGANCPEPHLVESARGRCERGASESG